MLIYMVLCPDMMGIDEKPGIEGKTVIPVERYGVKVISMAFSLKKMHPLFGAVRCLERC